ncbi:Hypothetical predicted protein [Paramuricea clavata]|uniref:Uncharacterized protein n=1 Tax=Paramuricea clavata TaxID=317549 RepID=A0A6S7JJN2_PARCT|nr:Hypothetical predicted protein [Paramuricea clavata]
MAEEFKKGTVDEDGVTEEIKNGFRDRAWRKQANIAEAVLADSANVFALQHERSILSERMDDLANTKIKAGGLFSREQSTTYEQWCRIHQKILSDLNTRISKLMDDRSSAISKRSHRSKTSGKSTSTKTSNSRCVGGRKC